MSTAVGPLLTDLYQLTMAYAYWRNGRHKAQASFDVFFRKNPFSGEYCVMAGTDEVLRFLRGYRFTDQHVCQLKAHFPFWPDAFYDYLRTLDGSQVRVLAIPDGSVVFPRVPLLRLEGDLAAVQLLETTVLNLVNFACLVTTNAARHRQAAGPDKTLLEFGLRRAQGPDGAMSASKYAFVGGFDGTSNVQAGVTYDIPVKGTHAHSFISSYTGLEDLRDTLIETPEGGHAEFVAPVREALARLYPGVTTNVSELAAFIAYAQAYPSATLTLVDTYDILRSGVPNTVALFTVLFTLGHQPLGIRIDSGDLAYLSRCCRKEFVRAEAETGFPFTKLTIVASNDIHESVLHALNDQAHDIDAFGIGTHLVTCKAQPALGGVFKLVEIDGQPRIKLSQDVDKVTIPGRKLAYRLYNQAGQPVADLLSFADAAAPRPHERVLCRDPFNEKRRVYVTPSRVEVLHQLVWGPDAPQTQQTLVQMRTRCTEGLARLRPDHLRPLNPTPYKVSVTQELFRYMHDLWEQESQVEEIV